MSELTPESGIGKTLSEARLIAVLVIDELEAAVPVAEALLRGGVTAMELTLRTPVAFDAAAAIRHACPACTSASARSSRPNQVVPALAAGAVFGVSPGVNPRSSARPRKPGCRSDPGS